MDAKFNAEKYHAGSTNPQDFVFFGSFSLNEFKLITPLLNQRELLFHPKFVFDLREF